MSSVLPFDFNAVEIYVVTINEKPWTRAREVCKALRYEKAARRVVRHHYTRENIKHKHQLEVVRAVASTVNWPRDSQKLDLYISEEGMYELLFSRQQPKAKDFRRHCWNVLFPHVWQQLTNKMKEEHQQAIEKKMQHLHCLIMTEKMVNMKMWHCKHKGMYFKTKSTNLLSIVLFPVQNIWLKTSLLWLIRETSPPDEDEFYEYPYYTARIKGRFNSTKNNGLGHNIPS